MSSVPQSTTSSPDVLGPEGDALYLISSPAPDFTGRQSWVPPYTLQTPRRQERMPRRTPNQSSHTMRFNDILLPSSPQMRQRSMSPTKMQSEGNLSPWRIRVTVEAEPEDEENTQDGPRKKLKPSTITTKVPLKDEETIQPSAKKRRGRPRKSDVREQSMSPIKGSPGRTPKLQAPSPAKRPRGRPRKSLQHEQSEPVAQSIEANGASARDNTQSIFQKSISERKSPTPFMTADIGSPSNASSEPDPFLDIAGSGAFEQSQDFGHNRLSPPVISHIPEPESTKTVRVIEGAQQTTPQESVSPPRQIRGISPENTLHAGHTPRPRRSYPTPTSSSLLDGNGGKSTMSADHNDRIQIFADPTNVHHEYDTIMESEDFSMVSLDTLPSAKQGGLSSILSSAKGALKPFVERQNTVSYDKAETRLTKSPQANNNNAIVWSTSTPRSKASQLRSRTESSNDRVLPVNLNQSTNDVQNFESSKFPTESKRKKTFSLARLVRLGLGLHGALSHQQTHSTKDIDEELAKIAVARDRLEDILSDFDADTQRQMQAGLKFGELVARRLMIARQLRRKEEERPESVRERNSSLEPESIESPRQEQVFDDRGLPGQIDLSRSQRLEAEWQRQREAVSHHIDTAESDNVIVLESDDDAPLQIGHHTEQQIFDEESEEDENYGDVWQEEAKNQDFSFERHRTSTTSSRERQATGSRDTVNDITENSFQSYHWDPTRGEIPPLGRSRMAQIREEEVDLSLLLRPRNTPKSRQYYANSSPRTALSQGLRSDRSSKYGVSVHDVSSPAQSSLLRSDRVSKVTETFSPDNDEEHAEVDNRDNVVDYEQIDEDEEDNEEEHGFEVGLDEEDYEVHTIDDEEENAKAPLNGPSSSIHTSAATPEQTINGSKQSWFRRVTNNFTPGWWATSKKGQIGETEMPLDESRSPPFQGGSSERSSSVSEQTPSLKRSRASRDAEEARHMEPLSQAYSAQSRTKRYQAASSPPPPVTLATSGYFTDAHYAALKRHYLEARRYPERFPYHPTAHRDAMLGDSLWTSDGEHGLPIAEIQFGILDRFVSELMNADLRNGGSGQIGWSEDDLHKRLFSIIVGDQIRRERKEQRLMDTAR